MDRIVFSIAISIIGLTIFILGIKRIQGPSLNGKSNFDTVAFIFLRTIDLVFSIFIRTFEYIDVIIGLLLIVFGISLIHFK